MLLFVGRLQPLKGPDVLLRAAAELVRRHPDWRDRLVVAVLGGPSGTGLARPHQLEELADGLGIRDVVRFLPPVDRVSLAQWYRAADVVTVPSHNESFGLVAIEAQACGTPVVAAEVGGLPVAVGEAGILVPTHESGDWADALESLLTDDLRRRGLGRRAVTHAAGFGWAATTDRLLEVYAEARRSRRHADTITRGGLRTLAGVPTAVIP